MSLPLTFIEGVTQTNSAMFCTMDAFSDLTTGAYLFNNHSTSIEAAMFVVDSRISNFWNITST